MDCWSLNWKTDVFKPKTRIFTKNRSSSLSNSKKKNSVIWVHRYYSFNFSTFFEAKLRINQMIHLISLQFVTCSKILRNIFCMIRIRSGYNAILTQSRPKVLYGNWYSEPLEINWTFWKVATFSLHFCSKKNIWLAAETCWAYAPKML